MILASDESEGFRYTPAEAAMLARLAETRVKADAGDRRAKAKIAVVGRQARALALQARRGNALAARRLRVLQESGILERSQTFTM